MSSKMTTLALLLRAFTLANGVYAMYRYRSSKELCPTPTFVEEKGQGREGRPELVTPFVLHSGVQGKKTFHISKTFQKGNSANGRRPQEATPSQLMVSKLCQKEQKEVNDEKSKQKPATDRRGTG